MPKMSSMKSGVVSGMADQMIQTMKPMRKGNAGMKGMRRRSAMRSNQRPSSKSFGRKGGY